MPQTPTTAFRTTAELDHYAPVILVEFLADMQHQYSTRAVTFSNRWKAGEGALCGGGLQSGAVHGTYAPLIARLAQGGLGTIAAGVTADGQRQVGNVTLTILNQEQAFTPEDLARLIQTDVQIRVGFSPSGWTEYLSVFRGVIDDIRRGADRTVTFQLLDGSFRRHRDLSTRIGQGYFPGAPLANKGKPIPIILGEVVNVQAIQVVGAAVGSLGFAIGTSETFIDLVEYGAPFPDSGTIDINTGGSLENDVPYTSRALVNVQGVTYLRLSGLTRSGVDSHSAGTKVELVKIDWVYLCGYAVSQVPNVREDGDIITTGFTVALSDSTWADRLVTTITFAYPASQPGVITFDATGPQVDLTNLLTNGGWEAGDNSSWTTSGATVNISTGDTTEGTYKAEVTGGAGSYGDNYQEFTTIIDEQYLVSLQLKDTQNTAGNLLTNGDFETGDTSGWTVETGELLPGFTTAGSLGVTTPAYEGTYAGQFTIPNQSAFYLIGAFYQDITTVASTTYFVHFVYKSGTRRAGSGGSLYQKPDGSVDYDPFRAVPVFLSPVLQALRPDGTLIDQSTFSIDTVTYFQTGKYYSSGWIVKTLQFVALDTTTRLQLRCLKYGSLSPTDAIIDNIFCIAGTGFPQALSGYQIGTSGDPDAYVSQTFQVPILRWIPRYHMFTAIDTTARLTLQSQYINASAYTQFDDCRAVLSYSTPTGLGSTNPVDAIEYIVDTFLPAYQKDQASFNAARAARVGQQFSAYLPDPGGSRALLARMARECVCRLTEDVDGRVTLTAYDPTTAPVYTFDDTNIREESLTGHFASTDDLATDIFVWFGRRDAAENSRAEDFQGVVYATPEGTTHPDIPLNAFCTGVATALRIRRRQELYAEFIQDVDTAHDYLTYLVEEATSLRRIWTLTTWLNAAHLYEYDFVILDMPGVVDTDGTGMVCEITERRWDPGAMELTFTLREVRPAGLTEHWEYAPVWNEIGAMDEGWES